MSLFSSTELNSLNDLFVNQIRDLYDAEQRITTALPKMIDATHSPELKQAFQSHLQETKGHVTRLETVFRQIGAEARRETCQARKGILDEGEEMVDAKGDPNVKDAALIAAAQGVEHYEIAGYGTARIFARRLGQNGAADLLGETLQEEKNADEKLTKVAESQVNAEAANA